MVGGGGGRRVRGRKCVVLCAKEREEEGGWEVERVGRREEGTKVKGKEGRREERGGEREGEREERREGGKEGGRVGWTRDVCHSLLQVKGHRSEEVDIVFCRDRELAVGTARITVVACGLS